jgi:hypothetical protein
MMVMRSIPVAQKTIPVAQQKKAAVAELAAEAESEAVVGEANRAGLSAVGTGTRVVELNRK